MSGLKAVLDDRFELRTLNLPGRQARFGEPNRVDLQGLVSELSSAIAVEDGRPRLLFGYCFGALLAYLVAANLTARSQVKDVYLAVASYVLPIEAEPAEELHLYPSERFWEALVLMGGIPAEVATRPDFRALVEPSVRADFQLISSFDRSNAAKVQMPVMILQGSDDNLVGAEVIQRWAKVTAGAPASSMINGAGHWLLDEAPAAVANNLLRFVQGLLIPSSVACRK